MIVSVRYWLAAALGVSLSYPCPGWAAAPTPSPLPQLRVSADPGNVAVTNQQMARIIAEQLRQGGQLRGYDIDVSYYKGTVELSGTVADQAQREEALRLVQGVVGVERVIDHLQLTRAIVRVQAGGEDRLQPLPPGPLEPLPTTGPTTGPNQGPPNGSPLPPAIDSNTPLPGSSAPPPGAGQPGAGAPLPGDAAAPPAAAAPAPPEAVPSFQAAAPYPLNPPKMPPYAWPTYAPYNNYSRVAYPDSYPYQAFPFIGPVYPFPKIPLGWREVKLQWEDGYWYFSKHATKWDWWRLRYW